MSKDFGKVEPVDFSVVDEDDDYIVIRNGATWDDEHRIFIDINNRDECGLDLEMAEKFRDALNTAIFYLREQQESGFKTAYQRLEELEKQVKNLYQLFGNTSNAIVEWAKKQSEGQLDD